MLRGALFLLLVPLCACYQSLHVPWRRNSPSMSSRRPEQQHSQGVHKPSPNLLGAALTTASTMASWSSAIRPVQAAPVPDPLPSNIRSLLEEVKSAQEPLVLRDAIKKLAEVESLDELYFDDVARTEVNDELKEVQLVNPDLWAPEALYYAGIVRRAVNPYHVIELQGWLKTAPFVGGAGYLIAIFVQRKLPQFFALAYFAAVASVVVPAGLIVFQ